MQEIQEIVINALEQIQTYKNSAKQLSVDVEHIKFIHLFTSVNSRATEVNNELDRILHYAKCATNLIDMKRAEEDAMQMLDMARINLETAHKDIVVYSEEIQRANEYMHLLRSKVEEEQTNALDSLFSHSTHLPKDVVDKFRFAIMANYDRAMECISNSSVMDESNSLVYVAFKKVEQISEESLIYAIEICEQINKMGTDLVNFLAIKEVHNITESVKRSYASDESTKSGLHSILLNENIMNLILEYLPSCPSDTQPHKSKKPRLMSTL